MTDVKIPVSAVAGQDISAPTTQLLEDLTLLPADTPLRKANGFASAFTGPPDSVALIEAGATAAAKWWSVALSGSVAVAWGAVRAWWGSATPENQHIALWSAAIITAAAIFGVAYLLGSDVRGRAAVAAETVRARAAVADAFVQMAEKTHATRAGNGATTATVGLNGTVHIAPLPSVAVDNCAKHGADEAGWRAVAVLTDGARITRYLIVKDNAHEWVDSDIVRFS